MNCTETFGSSVVVVILTGVRFVHLVFDRTDRPV
jgi:hypothetical protein